MNRRSYTGYCTIVVWFGLYTVIFAAVIPFAGSNVEENSIVLAISDMTAAELWHHYPPAFAAYLAISVGIWVLLILWKLAQWPFRQGSKFVRIDQIGDLPVGVGEWTDENRKSSTRSDDATMGRPNRMPFLRSLWCAVWIWPFFLLFSLYRQLLMHMTQVAMRAGRVVPAPIGYNLARFILETTFAPLFFDAERGVEEVRGRADFFYAAPDEAKRTRRLVHFSTRRWGAFNVPLTHARKTSWQKTTVWSSCRTAATQ